MTETDIDTDVPIPPPASTVLSFERVGLVLGSAEQRVHAIDHVDLHVAAGELVAVTGRSGSGKSSLLNLAGGLVEATIGTVTVAGERLTGSSDREKAAIRRRHVGYVFQDLNLLPTLTAVENVALPLELDRWRRAEATSEATTALDRVGLGGLGDRHPDQLSGGQRQRVAIARGLVGRRSLLLADEPTSALDDLTGEEIIRLIRARCDEGAAALVVTHEPSLAGWADRVIRLQRQPGEPSIESEAIRPARRPDLADLTGMQPEGQA
ncbi:MAG: ABC transporter ATP-binding protein [Actinomycetota bacterium]